MLHRSPNIPHRFSRGGERPGDAQSLAKVLFLLRGTVHGGGTRISASLSPDAIQRQEKVEVDFISVSSLPVPPGQHKSWLRAVRAVWSGLRHSRSLEESRSSFPHGRTWMLSTRSTPSLPLSTVARILQNCDPPRTEPHDPCRPLTSASKNKDKVNAHVPPHNQDVPTQNDERKQGTE